LEVYKSPIRTPIRSSSYRRAIFMRSELSTIIQLNGLLNNAPAMFHSQEHIILHVKFNKIKCLFSEAAIHQTKDIMTHIISNYVNIFLICSDVPMVSTTKSKINWSTKKRYVKDRRTVTQSISFNGMV
jgi:hypothetical protein